MVDSETSEHDVRNAALGGRRLRVDNQKRTENEYRQMLRLAEIENKELKDSLRYVEVQLAKTKDTLRQTNKKLDEKTEEVQNCHDQIGRQANINSAQVQQIEEMSKVIGESDAKLQDAHSKNKIAVQTKQNEIDLRESEINSLKKQLEQKDVDLSLAMTNCELQKERADDLDAEMLMKSKENNRLRIQVADIETAMQDLYRSRKGKGTVEIELESLKSDNEHLLSLLKDTSEYCDFEDEQIIKSAKTKSLTGARAYDESFAANKRARTGSADAVSVGGQSQSKSKLNNDWIPTEAVRAIFKIREKHGNELNDYVISRILYELNTIWRNIMRQEIDAQRKKLMAQIQDLRRQVVTKQAFDKGELMQEISRTKRQLGFAEKQLINKNRIGGASKENSMANGQQSTTQYSNEDIERTMRMVEQLGGQKKRLEEENEELRAKVAGGHQNNMGSTIPHIMKNNGGFDAMSNSVSDL